MHQESEMTLGALLFVTAHVVAWNSPRQPIYRPRRGPHEELFIGERVILLLGKKKNSYWKVLTRYGIKYVCGDELQAVE